MALFTPEELAALEEIDEKIEETYHLTNEDMKRSRQLDREAQLEAMDPKQRKIADQQKAYYEANREKIADQKKAYYEANREKIADYQKAYREANREKIADYQKAYYEANREKWNQYMRQYRQRKKLAAT